MNGKQIIFGFGFKPEKSSHHFLVRKNSQSVLIYERFDWQEDVILQKINYHSADKAKEKAEISKHRWMLLEEAVRTEFNGRLKKQKLPAGRFVVGHTPLEQLLGKELLVLVWAVEYCDMTDVPIAIRNWLGLYPEERWWLYTMTNAATGNIYDRSGWRMALRYALAENPVMEGVKC